VLVIIIIINSPKDGLGEAKANLPIGAPSTQIQITYTNTKQKLNNTRVATTKQANH